MNKLDESNTNNLATEESIYEDTYTVVMKP